MRRADVMTIAGHNILEFAESESAGAEVKTTVGHHKYFLRAREQQDCSTKIVTNEFYKIRHEGLSENEDEEEVVRRRFAHRVRLNNQPACRPSPVIRASRSRAQPMLHSQGSGLSLVH